MRPRRLIVLGTMASDPYAGMAWMTMQLAAGLKRLGHDAWYFETTSAWPFDPARNSKVCDSDYALPYLARVAGRFGLGDRWAYRRSYSDKAWFGLTRTQAEELLASADAVFNVAGATRVAEEGLRAGRLVYLGTDPVIHEAAYAGGVAGIRTLIDEHTDVITYGENIGRPDCRIPPLPRLRATTRQPVLLDLWDSDRTTRVPFTTVGNWNQSGPEVILDGERYHWSKHHEFLRFLELPSRIQQPVEFATNLAELAEGKELLESHGWRLTDARDLTTDPWRYQEYILSSKGEFTVARDLNVRLRSGWFSERSACYLAAGLPVITQNTGFGTVLPVGEGLFAFDSWEEIIAGFEAVAADYPRHRRAARAIAEDYFRAETVLAKLLEDLGI